MILSNACSRDALRWGAAVVFAALLHVGVVCVLVHRAEEASEDGGAPVVMMELAPVASAPAAQPADLPPGPEQEDSDEQQAARAMQKDRPRDEPRPKDEAESDRPDTLPMPEKPPEPRQQQQAQASEAAEAAAPPAADRISDQAKGPPIGADARKPSQAVINWRNSMLGRLKRFHRYPMSAHGASGTAWVEFTIDRDGRLMRRRVVKGSGNGELDRDAEGLIGRAAPFPPPPQGASNGFLSISVPVRYDSRQK